MREPPRRLSITVSTGELERPAPQARTQFLWRYFFGANDWLLNGEFAGCWMTTKPRSMV